MNSKRIVDRVEEAEPRIHRPRDSYITFPTGTGEKIGAFVPKDGNACP